VDFFIDVPTGSSDLNIGLAGIGLAGIGDADIHVRRDGQPSFFNYDFRSNNNNSSEQVIVSPATSPPLTAMRWYISIYAFQDASWTLTATITPPPVNYTPLVSGSLVTRTEANGKWADFYTEVPVGTTQLDVILSGTGDGDPYVRRGAKPDNVSWDFRPSIVGSAEVVIVSGSSTPPVAADRWYISVKSDSVAVVNYTLTASINPTPGATATPTATPTPTPVPDADLDGLPDACEVASPAATGASNVLLADSDGDGLLDGEEQVAVDCTSTIPPKKTTDPRKYDTDGDGYSDGLEFCVLSSDPLLASSPNKSDSANADADADADGLPNGIDPDSANRDTDGDGYLDGYERTAGTDPTSASSHPALGDLNGSGCVWNSDIIRLKQQVAGANPTSIILQNMDVTLDGRFTNSDVIRLKQFVGNCRKLP